MMDLCFIYYTLYIPRQHTCHIYMRYLFRAIPRVHVSILLLCRNAFLFCTDDSS
jgi:hypothetical protein